MKRFQWLMLAAVFGCLTLGILAAQGKVKKLATYGYAVEKGNISFIVDMDLARYRGGDKYIPLQVILGSDGNDVLNIDRTSFTLTDPSGKTHPVATPEEVLKGYGATRISSDYHYYRRARWFQNYSWRFQLTHIFPLAFYPNPSGRPGVIRDQIKLTRQTAARTMLYFANPDGKASGTYTLTYKDPKTGTTLSIPFTIPWHK